MVNREQEPNNPTINSTDSKKAPIIDTWWNSLTPNEREMVNQEFDAEFGTWPTDQN